MDEYYMYNLADINTIKKLLSGSGFSFKKSLGQNFIVDSFVCPQMAQEAITDETCVLEIGPGIGVLTVELAQLSKKVVAIELDERLRPVLSKTLADFNNTEVVFGDALKIDLASLIAEKFDNHNKVAVCANLPYYITSPVIMMLLESRLNIESITVMVQKEAAKRLCAEVGSRDSGAITVAINYYSSPQFLFDVDRSSFFPSPNVDSSVIKLNIRKTPPVIPTDEKLFLKLIRASFEQRRKTFINSVSAVMQIPKDNLLSTLNELDINPQIRAEKLTLQQFSDISDQIKNY